MYPRLLATIFTTQGRVGPYPSLRYNVHQTLYRSEQDIDNLLPPPPTTVISQDKHSNVSRRLEDIAGYLAYAESTDQTALLERLVVVGEWISDNILPAESLCCCGSSLPRTIEIATDQQDIPWELCIVDGAFLGSQVVQARYPLIGKARTGSSSYGRPARVAIVVGNTSGLSQASDEVAAITSLCQNLLGRQPDLYDGDRATANTMRSLLAPRAAMPPYDVIHFIGHGEANSDHVWLELFGSPFLDTHVPPRIHGNPLIFWNACQVGAATSGRFRHQTDVLDSLGARLLSAGAGHFIGSLFPVFDDTGASFAAEFYSLLLQGDSVGISLLKAKQAIEATDPLVHAYVAYGNPTVRLVNNA